MVNDTDLKTRLIQDLGLSLSDIASYSINELLMRQARSTLTSNLYVSKSVNEGRTTTARTTDAELFINAPANSVWEITWHIHATVPVANDADFSIVVPAGGTGRFDVIGPAATTTLVTGGEGVFKSNSVGAANTCTIGGNAGDLACVVWANVTVTTAGVVGLQYGMNTGVTGPLTVYAGSNMRARRIS